MSVFDNHYFRINKFFLSCTGLWPYLSTGRKRVMRTIVLIAVTLYLIPTVGGLYEVWGKLDLMVECLIPIFTAFACLVCTITYMSKEKQILYLDSRLFSLLNSHLFSIFDRCSFFILRACITLTAVTYILTTMTPQILNIILPLNETRPKKLPSRVEYFVNWEENFEYILVHIIIITIIEACVLIGCRSTCSVLTDHACGLFSNAGNRLKNTINNIDSDKVRMEPHLEDAIYKDVTFCIENHLRAIEFSETIESCFSPCFFFIMGLSVILISTTLIEIIVHLDETDDAIKFGVYTVGLIIDLYFNNLPAQKLMDYSTSIPDHILEGTWYRIPLKSQKLLIMIMMRSRIPCKLTAGKMYVMSLNNFSKVLQNSLSYFTLLSSMRS
ncbi:uncharacterized protein LOC117173749 [Belonocnema kinseyi]|uniref:uncharacterized protein LOC117173749 n=1 Tax=Belonocnema kinseyi TaxID=2817044 RepID=UPI00143DF772|nr:uncharacterized protein LOC117173749 [Belonocnema kinseyi]